MAKEGDRRLAQGTLKIVLYIIIFLGTFCNINIAILQLVSVQPTDIICFTSMGKVFTVQCLLNMPRKPLHYSKHSIAVMSIHSNATTIS